MFLFHTDSMYVSRVWTQISVHQIQILIQIHICTKSHLQKIPLGFICLNFWFRSLKLSKMFKNAQSHNIRESEEKLLDLDPDPDRDFSGSCWTCLRSLINVRVIVLINKKCNEDVNITESAGTRRVLKKWRLKHVWINPSSKSKLLWVTPLYSQ